MIDQWNELKETITELIDGSDDGSDQQEIYKFLVNYMGVLEKQFIEEADCVNRQKVIQIVNNKFNSCTGIAECIDLARIKDEIKDLPSVIPQRWIPVSERLPEEETDVLTCGLGGFIEIQSFENAHDGYWENQNGAWSDLDEVSAWMPLPEPYKEESEEQK